MKNRFISPNTLIQVVSIFWKTGEINNAEIRTAWEFIDKIASASGTSGKPYLIRFQDGREINSRDFLIAELNKLELN